MCVWGGGGGGACVCVCVTSFHNGEPVWKIRAVHCVTMARSQKGQGPRYQNLLLTFGWSSNRKKQNKNT